MATIMIKRGLRVPTTTALTKMGEMAVNYQTGYVYIRCIKGIMCINTNTLSTTTTSSATS